MRNEWLIGTATAALGLLVVAGSATAENVQVARMVSPAAQNSAIERAAPAKHGVAAKTQEPTTIGEETLRHLMATISPEDESHAHPAAKSVKVAEAKPIKKAKGKKHHARGKHKAAHRHAAKQPTVLGGNAPAQLKPCHKAHPVPAFVREGETVKPVQPVAPWQTRQLRFGPRA